MSASVATIEKLVSAVVDYGWTTGPLRQTGHDEDDYQARIAKLRERFTAILDTPAAAARPATTSIFPRKVRSIADMAGALENLEGVESVVALVQDETGVWIMPVCFAGKEPTNESVNWMLSRAWLLLHGLVQTREENRRG